MNKVEEGKAICFKMILSCLVAYEILCSFRALSNVRSYIPVETTQPEPFSIAGLTLDGHRCEM